MILEMFSIKDIAANAYHKPFFVQNKEVMQRAVLSAKEDPNSTINFHPQDYQVYYLGTYDDATGVMKAQAPEFVLNIADLKERE